MSVQKPIGGFLVMHRLIKTCTSRYVGHSDVLINLTKTRQEIRTFLSGSVRCTDTSDSSRLSTKLPSRQALLARRRRPLSPLERVSGLLSPDDLSPEVVQLRQQDQEAEGGTDIQTAITQHTPEQSGRTDTHTGDERTPEEEEEEGCASDVAVEPNTSEGQTSPVTLPGENLLTFGEFLIAEYFKKGRVEFRKMFKLERGARLNSSWGFILHDNIAGLPAGQFLKTSVGLPMFIRRASLEDYVLYMRRAPAIAYPKVFVHLLFTPMFHFSSVLL